MGIEDQWQEDAEQSPTAETTANLSEEDYYREVTTLAEKVLSALLDEDGSIESVKLHIILGCLQPVDELSASNPFSIMEHTDSTLGAYDEQQIDGLSPISGLVEQAQRLLAGDVQKRILEAVSTSEVDVQVKTKQQAGQR